VNCLPLSVSAACLMRSRALCTPSRPCVRSVFCEFAFPLACPLPSTPSACGFPPSSGSIGAPWPCPAFPPSCPFRFAIAPDSSFLRPLFGDFVGTTVQSDFLLRTSMASVLGLPIAAHGAIAVGGCRISRFSRKVLPRMLGVFDRARPRRTSPCRCVGCCLRLPKGPRRLGAHSISRLNTRPACTPVHASGTSLRPCPQDSGSSWVAGPSMCDFLLRYTLPVYPGASPGTSSRLDLFRPQADVVFPTAGRSPLPAGKE